MSGRSRNWEIGLRGKVGKEGKGDIPCGEDISFVCCNESTALLSSYKSARAYEGNSLAYDDRLFISRDTFFRVLYHFPEISDYQQIAQVESIK
jgi:hypothetical protein